MTENLEAGHYLSKTSRNFLIFQFFGKDDEKCHIQLLHYSGSYALTGGYTGASAKNVATYWCTIGKTYRNSAGRLQSGTRSRKTDELLEWK